MLLIDYLMGACAPPIFILAFFHCPFIRHWKGWRHCVRPWICTVKQAVAWASGFTRSVGKKVSAVKHGRGKRWVQITKKGAINHLGGERLKNDSTEDRTHELCLVRDPRLSR